MNMKFAILLLAFFIPLFTSTSALKCYICQTEGPGVQGKSLLLPELERAGQPPPDKDCSKSNGDEILCTSANPGDDRCLKVIVTGTVVARTCASFIALQGEHPEIKTDGCHTVKNNNNLQGTFCLCSSDLCNGDNGIVGMSLTTLLGGVMALLLIK